MILKQTFSIKEEIMKKVYVREKLDLEGTFRRKIRF